MGFHKLGDASGKTTGEIKDLKKVKPEEKKEEKPKPAKSDK